MAHYNAVVDSLGVSGDFVEMKVSIHMLTSVYSVRVRLPVSEATDTEAIRKAILSVYNKLNLEDFVRERELSKKLLGISFPIELPDTPEKEKETA